MLSVATAAVHRSMRPKMPTPTSSPPNLIVTAGLPWNTDVTPTPKRRRSRQRPCSARKKLIPSPTEDKTLDFNLNSSEITLTPIRKKPLDIGNDQIENDGQRDCTVFESKTDIESKSIETNNRNLEDDIFVLEEIRSNPNSLEKKSSVENITKPSIQKSAVMPFVNSGEISISPIVKSMVPKSDQKITENASQSEISIIELYRSKLDKTGTEKELSTSLLENSSLDVVKPKEPKSAVPRIPFSKNQAVLNNSQPNIENHTEAISVPEVQTAKTGNQSPNRVSLLKTRPQLTRTAISPKNFYRRAQEKRTESLKLKEVRNKDGSNDVESVLPASQNQTGTSPKKNLTAEIVKAMEILKNSETTSSIDISSSGIGIDDGQKHGEVLSSTKRFDVVADSAMLNLDEICDAFDLGEIPEEMGNVWDPTNIERSEKTSLEDVIQSSTVPVQDGVFVLTENDLQEPYHMTGFPNPPGENRCWLNATLQALFALPLLDTFNKFNLHEASKLTKFLVATRVHWMKGEIGKDKAYQNVKLLKEELGTLDETYPSERQQDVSEFLMILLNHVKADFDKLVTAEEQKQEAENIPENEQDSPWIPKTPQTPGRRQPLADISMPQNNIKRSRSLGEASLSPALRKQSLTFSVQDLLSPKVRRLSNPMDPSYKVHTPPLTSANDENIIYRNPIEENFLLHMMEHYTCKGCAKHRQKKVDNLMLFIDMPADDAEWPVDLREAVKRTLAPEERSLTCGTCKHETHSMRISFRRRPKILTVQINRYGLSSEGVFAKINSPVKIPESLVLGPDLVDDALESTDSYEPVCIIAHAGSTMDCGHYTSYVKHGNQWYHYNDMNVAPMTSEEALSAAQFTAYVVFFVESGTEQDSG